jgi:hypothetical protein
LEDSLDFRTSFGLISRHNKHKNQINDDGRADPKNRCSYKKEPNGSGIPSNISGDAAADSGDFAVVRGFDEA